MRALALALQPALIGIVIKGTLVLLVAAAASFLLRRGAASGRYVIWSSALVVLIALPILLVALPSWNLPFDTSFLNLDLITSGPVSEPLEEQGSTDEFHVGTAGPSTPEPRATLLEGAESGASGDVAAPLPLSRAMSRISRANTAAFVIWIVGSFLVLGRLLFGFAGIWWLARQARPVMDRDLLDLARKLSDDIDLKTPVRLLQSDRSITPMTWGITWPAILLPKDASEWSDERHRMILLHELAHVKRRDCLVQFVVWLACSLYWMNPLVWIAVRKMHIERERACDDLVLDSGFQGSDYAEHLLEIARSLRTAPPPPLLSWSPSLAQPPSRRCRRAAPNRWNLPRGNERPRDFLDKGDDGDGPHAALRRGDARPGRADPGILLRLSAEALARDRAIATRSPGRHPPLSDRHQGIPQHHSLHQRRRSAGSVHG